MRMERRLRIYIETSIPMRCRIGEEAVDRIRYSWKRRKRQRQVNFIKFPDVKTPVFRLGM